MKRVFTAVLAVCIGRLSVGTVAQPDNSLEKRVFKLKYQPSFVDNYSYKVFYVSNGKVYNLMNFALAERLENAASCPPAPLCHVCRAGASGRERAEEEVQTVEEQGCRAGKQGTVVDRSL